MRPQGLVRQASKDLHMTEDKSGASSPTPPLPPRCRPPCQLVPWHVCRPGGGVSRRCSTSLSLAHSRPDFSSSLSSLSLLPLSLLVPCSPLTSRLPMLFSKFCLLSSSFIVSCSCTQLPPSFAICFARAPHCLVVSFCASVCCVCCVCCVCEKASDMQGETASSRGEGGGGRRGREGEIGAKSE